MEAYLDTLTAEFKRNGNPEIANGQKAYLKDQFEHFGLKAPLRKEIQRPFFDKQHLPSKRDLPELVKTLWELTQRDFQMFGQELVFKYKKQFEKEDIKLFEFMITNKSWWDSVDFIAVKIVGEYFKQYPEEISKVIPAWMSSGNIWLQRSCLLFQLQYKEKLDTDLLDTIIQPLLGSKEFFINKAIGWVLRHYSRTNPTWVTNYVEKTPLHSLSKREAMRLIK